MSVHKAAEEFGVPRTTLQDRLNEVSGESLGRKRVFTDAEEKLIVSRIMVGGIYGQRGGVGISAL